MERCYFDLSEPQKSIWLTHQVYDEMNHSVTVDVLFQGKAELTAAHRAVNALYLFNQILRAELTDTDGVPKQFFHDFDEGKAYGTIRVFPNPDEYKQWAEEYALQKMGDTLCEISVIDAGAEFGFLIKASHMIIDGMSAVLLLTRLKQYYNAYRIGEEVVDTEYRYQDFLERENLYYQDSAGLSRDRAYWKKKIGEIDSPTIVSTNNVESVRSQRLLIPLSPDEENNLKQFCKEKGVSEFGVLLSCFALCVSAHFRTDITTIICTILNRVGVKENKTPGMFVNTLPLVLDCGPESMASLSAADYIKAAQQEFYRSSRHFRYSYNHILGEYYQLRGRRELSDITFSYQTFDALSSGDYAREDFNPTWYFCGTQTNSLSFHARREPKEGMKLIFEYQTEKFSEEDVRLFGTHLLETLHSLFANPGQKMADLEMISDWERERILRDFNDTRAAYPEDKTVVDLFEEQVRRTPDNTALKFLGQTMTYAELNAKANSIAFRLRELGIQPGDHVAIMGERRMEIIAGILGTVKAGAAYVPIDPGYPADRIRYVLEDSAAGVVLTCQADASAGTEIKTLDLCDAGAYAAARENPPHVSSSDDLAYIIYTSGTTGRPKGVMIEHRGVVNLWKRLAGKNLRETDTVLQFSSLSFDVSVYEMLMSLMIGASLCLIPSGVIQDTKAFEQYVMDHGVTIVALPPAYAAQIDLKGYRRVITAGSPAKRETVLRANALGIEFVNEYGPTEVTVVSNNWDSLPGTPVPAVIPIGPPQMNKQIYILNGLRLCGIGVPGELCIAGAGLARGYLNQPELTAEKFIRNPFGEGRMYRSGDLARWMPDGNIEYLGRIDEQVKIRGYRIELGEIESVLRKQAGVADAAVIVRIIGADESLCAYVVPERMQNPDMPAIREGLKKELPEYMLPAFMTQVEQLPLNRSGKLDKQALPEPDALSGRAYTAPGTGMEQLLVEVYEQTLGLSPIGIDDSFFFLGGHSLKATMLVNKIEECTGIRLPLRTVFRSPTPRMLAQELEAPPQSGNEAIPAVEQKDHYATSSAQKRLFILDQIAEGSLAYHLPSAIEVRGGLDPERIQSTVAKLLKRHEALRTSFALIDGEAVQRIADEADCKVEYEETERFGREDMTAFLRPFDLGQAPLMRLKLIKERSGDRYILLFDIHHIIADALTINILTEEFSRLYNGEDLQAPERQYKHYSEWMRGRDLSAQKEYWMKVFAEEAPVLDMTTDYPRPQAQSFEGATVSARLDREQREGIEKINRENGTTTFMTLLAAFIVELYKYSRQEDIVVGVPLSGRVHKDTETMMGMFVNTLALRGYPSADKTFLAFLAEIKEHTLGVLENQEYPFEQLLEDVRLRRDMSRNPLFDVMFAMRNEGTALRLGGAELQVLEMAANTAKFDLTLQVEETESGYSLDLEYCSDLYSEASAAAMLEHFCHLLRSIIANPLAKLSELEMTSLPERERILSEFNDTSVEYAMDKTVVELFEEQVRQTPMHTALKFEGQTMTYAELNAKANRLAHRLKELGIAPESKIALIAERGMEMIVGILGVLKAGGAYVPIDPAYPEDRIRYMLEDSAVRAVLTYQTKLPEGTSVRALDLGDGRSYAAATGNLPRVNKPTDLIYVIYTSGTTGRPKGVMIEHRGVVNLRKRLERNKPCETDTILQFASISFDAATYEMAMALLFGGALCLIPNTVIQDLKAFEKYIDAHGVTMALLPPAYAAQTEWKPFRRIITGGSAANRETIIRADALGIDFVNEYGPTEVTVTASSWDYPAGSRVPAVIPIGRPIENTQIYMMNGSELCGIGVPGELHIAGAGLARGYLNQPELTAERFITNQYGEGRLYRSGDLARWLPDGNIEYLGRIDEQVKIRGYRIELGEIENVLRKQPGVADAAAVTRIIGGEETLCAYIATEHGADPDIAVIREGLAKELPDYMIPVFITELDALPFNRSGKLDKRALPEPDALASRAYTAPETDMERITVQVFEEILALSPIGI
ncbi:MAG: amino acid adenylation domain-containing protein, partial [Clostridiales bacterium]|nr:amino acid adenylation domain-containing protein [Clostridiales bacterium]